MISINSNLSSLIVQSSLKNSTTGVNKAIQRMTTGYKINGAKDNAAGHFISTSLSTKISAYQVAEENVSMGLDMVQTASSSLSQMSDLASRLRSLATQASNGTYDKSSLASIDSEANAIVKEMFRIQSTTSYNGRNLLTSETGGASGIATQSADVAVQSVAVQAATTSVRAGKSGFINEIQKRDTSGMTTLASVDENTTLSSGTYSISTAEELAKLATMTKNHKVTSSSVEFVLANDIDLSAYSTGEGWTPIDNLGCTFDGNGYKVKNLYINRPNAYYQGLFGSCHFGKIKNVGVENANVTGYDRVGALVGAGDNISNCYSTGRVCGRSLVAGLDGVIGAGGTITNCYSACIVKGDVNYIGGLVGQDGGANITNCFATGDVTGSHIVGGLIGDSSSLGTKSNIYATGRVTASSSYSQKYVGGLVGMGIGINLDNAYYLDTTGQTVGIGYGTPTSGTATMITQKELKNLIAQGLLPSSLLPDIALSLQVGINGDDSCQIGLTLSQIDLSPLDGLSMADTSALDTIDSVLKLINEQQTNIGAAENRLTSALEQISVAYDNLVSTRSTIRDADIADESSNYIKMQILQQASATLLATANQNPSIALQLI